MLRMTKQADYGIVLLSRMAQDPGRRFAAPELAELTRLPLPTVSKVLKLLGRGGLLQSHRGVKGGYSLAAMPTDITVAQMIQVLDGPIAFTECIEDTPGECSQEAFCSIRGNWQRINRAVRQALEAISLADLCDQQHPPLIQLGSGRPQRNTDSPELR
ncbi:MAG: SUF system Fe-S cluster assembly regulator [Acidobacteriota bacterium]